MDAGLLLAGLDDDVVELGAGTVVRAKQLLAVPEPFGVAVSAPARTALGVDEDRADLGVRPAGRGRPVGDERDSFVAGGLAQAATERGAAVRLDDLCPHAVTEVVCPWARTWSRYDGAMAWIRNVDIGGLLWRGRVTR